MQTSDRPVDDWVKAMRAAFPDANLKLVYATDGNGRVFGTPPDRSRSIPWDFTEPMVRERERGRK